MKGLKAWWTGLAAREQRMVGLAAAVLLFFVVFTVGVRPAWRTLSGARAQMEKLDVQLQQMQRLASEAAALRATPPVPPGQAEAALKAATERLGDKGRLTMQGERAVLQLNGAGTEQLRSWLAEVRSAARARPVEAQLSRAASGYSGTIVVAVGGAGG